MFKAFIDPTLLRQWWGPRGFTVEHLDFPAIEGHRYSVRLRAPDGTVFAHEGVFLEVVPPARLSYTWRWTMGPLDGADTLVELTFVPEGQGVTVRLAHSRFASQVECDRHVGWAQSLEALADWLHGGSG